ncbi:hypothetical protein CVR96_27555, partial [Salmonella enterica subsp. enterica serovar Typhimurium]|uniref:hypothetical protein n=1 Tax=Salmonella enterica TaxID=28901 RepID=UPI000CC62CE1
ALDTINNTTLPTLESGLSNLENTVVPSIQSDVSINADEISQRLTSTEVDNLVEGKGYSTAINNVEATADGNKST